MKHIDIPVHYGAWYYSCGNIIENQQTNERYLIIESTLEDMANGE